MMMPKLDEYLTEQTTVPSDKKEDGKALLMKYGPPEEWQHGEGPQGEERKLCLQAWSSMSRGEQDDFRMEWESREVVEEKGEDEATEETEAPEAKEGESDVDARLADAAKALDSATTKAKPSRQDVLRQAVDAAAKKMQEGK